MTVELVKGSNSDLSSATNQQKGKAGPNAQNPIKNNAISPDFNQSSEKRISVQAEGSEAYSTTRLRKSLSYKVMLMYTNLANWKWNDNQPLPETGPLRVLAITWNLHGKVRMHHVCLKHTIYLL